MKKIIILILGAILATFTSIFGQDLEEVLENYYEASGMDALQKVNTMTVKGKILQMGMEMPFTIYSTRSGKNYLEVPIQGQLMKRGFDGEVAWMVAPWSGSLDPIELTGIQLKSVRIQADMDGMLYDYKKKGYETVLEGKEDMEGTQVYTIKQTDSDGDVYYHYIDAENFIPLKTKGIINVQGSKVEAESFMSNYKMVEGIAVAHSIESRVNGQTQSQILVEEVILNENVNDSIFEKPAPAVKEEEQGQE